MTGTCAACVNVHQSQPTLVGSALPQELQQRSQADVAQTHESTRWFFEWRVGASATSAAFFTRCASVCSAKAIVRGRYDSAAF